MRQNVLLRMAQAAMLFSIIIETTPLTRAAPLSLAFTYQGQLSDGLNRASGFYDFTFALYDAASLGNQVGDAIQIDGVPVSNGVFTVTLDFGSAFNGNARWLEIHVRTNLAADAVILSPRQPMRATPYALFSRTSGALNGILPDSQLSGNIARLNAPQVFTATVGFSPSSGSPFTVSSSERVPNLNADLLDGLDSLAFAPASHDHGNTYWKLLGNAGTTAGTHFLGTTDNQPLELKVNGQRALRLEPNTNAPNVIAGHPGNFVMDAVGVTIGGGATNAITGGLSPSSYSGIASGSANGIHNSSYSTICGGTRNGIQGIERNAFPTHSGTIGGGGQNVIEDSIYAVIVGGRGNRIAERAIESTIAGGALNSIPGRGSTRWATIGGGIGNWNNGHSSTIGGGEGNRIRGGGDSFFAFQLFSGTIGGGSSNVIDAPGSSCTIAGGSGNSVTTAFSGFDYSASGSVIGGGTGNAIWAPSGSCTIAGGTGNSIASNQRIEGAAIGGGSGNRIFGSFGTVPGGEANVATKLAFAAGTRAKANHDGSFVWGDATDADVSSTSNNQFTVRASGGTRIFSDSASSVGVQLLPGDNAWSVLSDRNAKQNLEAVDCGAVLEKVAALPVTTWQLKSQPASVRHMGPMAQDFQAAFGLGEEGRLINTSDADGVAFAAIKGLHEALKAKEKEISDLKAESSALKARLEKLERLLVDR